MVIAAENDLELRLMDTVNAFVNYTLDEIVFIRLQPYFKSYGRVLRLRKTLYSLRR